LDSISRNEDVVSSAALIGEYLKSWYNHMSRLAVEDWWGGRGNAKI